jgi:hypothetical protein
LTLIACALIPAPVHAVPIPLVRDFKVSGIVLDDHNDPAIAISPAGQFLVGWLKSGEGLFGRRYGSNGLPTAPEFQIAASGALLDVAMHPTGGFLAVWIAGDGDESGIFARLYDSADVPQGPAFIVNATTAGSQYNPAVASDPAGNFVVTWQIDFNSGVAGQRLDGSGTPQGGEFVITALGQNPRVAKDAAGNFIVAWSRFTPMIIDNVYAQRYDAAGVAQGTEIAVPLRSSQVSIGPGVAADAPGNFVVMADYEAQRYDNSGTPSGLPFDTIGAGIRTIGMDDGGGLVVVGHVPRPQFPRDKQRIYGQRHDGSGVPLSPMYLVSGSTLRDRGTVVVAVAPDGRYGVAWQDGSGFDTASSVIYARFYAHEAPVKGSRFELRDGPSPSDRRVILRVRDRIVATRPGAGLDPTVDATFLHVFNSDGSGEAVCLPLPAGGWTVRGRPEKPTYVYSDPGYAYGPCRNARVRDGSSLSVTCDASVQPIAYSLDEPQQGSVGIELVSGDAKYCANFGGRVAIDSAAAQQFKASRAPAPVSCPTPPTTCP